jgi:hypothetical protein
MEAARFSETSVHFYKTIQRHISGDSLHSTFVSLFINVIYVFQYKIRHIYVKCHIVKDIIVIVYYYYYYYYYYCTFGFTSSRGSFCNCVVKIS